MVRFSHQNASARAADSSRYSAAAAADLSPLAAHSPYRHFPVRSLRRFASYVSLARRTSHARAYVIAPVITVSTPRLGRADTATIRDTCSAASGRIVRVSKSERRLRGRRARTTDKRSSDRSFAAGKTRRVIVTSVSRLFVQMSFCPRPNKSV